MFKIWGQSQLMNKSEIVEYLQNVYGVIDQTILAKAEKMGGAKIGKMKILYLR